MRDGLQTFHHATSIPYDNREATCLAQSNCGTLYQILCRQQGFKILRDLHGLYCAGDRPLLAWHEAVPRIPRGNRRMFRQNARLGPDTAWGQTLGNLQKRASNKKNARLGPKAEHENDDDAIHEARHEVDADDAALVAGDARGRTDRDDVVDANHVARRAVEHLQIVALWQKILRRCDEYADVLHSSPCNNSANRSYTTASSGLSAGIFTPSVTSVSSGRPFKSYASRRSILST